MSFHRKQIDLTGKPVEMFGKSGLLSPEEYCVDTFPEKDIGAAVRVIICAPESKSQKIDISHIEVSKAGFLSSSELF